METYAQDLVFNTTEPVKITDTDIKIGDVYKRAADII